MIAHLGKLLRTTVAVVAVILVPSYTYDVYVQADSHTGSHSYTYGSSLDPSSYANVDQFIPEHLSFYLEIDFDRSAVIGTVTHTLQTRRMDTVSVDDDDEAVVYMDVWDGLTVETAEFMAETNITTTTTTTTTNTTDTTSGSCPTNWTVVPFEISTPNPNIGNALGIQLPCTPAAGTTFYLRFNYVTNPNNWAMSWLTPEQTAGKVMPYMYSLCQMNFCRDFAPMMDTPSQKITYNATVIAPKEFVVRMSANTTSEAAPYNDTHTIATFDAAIQIPSYLIAIVVGDLVEAALDERVSVISEPYYLEAAVEEFSELPEILDIAETYLNPYVWGSYAIVIMPPSFPWGGMEHPLVTFASHTLLTGDKSKVDTAIHEITHSWFGNDVGCQNWNHFWLNEGLNVFMERKTLALLRGEDIARIEYYNGNISVYNDMLDYGLSDSYSSLYPDIQDDDPENSFSSLPYEKGSQFVYYMETLLGEELMQQMLQSYLVTFSQQTVTESDLRGLYTAFVYENFDNATAADILVKTDWDTWVFEPGLPPVTLNFTTAALTNAQILAQEYLALQGESSPMNYTVFLDFMASQKVAFVQTLAESGQVTAAILEYIDMDLNITAATNPDVKTEWYILGIWAGYGAVLEPANQWVGEQGRNAYVRPIYQALVDAGMCDTAKEWFAQYELFYNSYVVNGVQNRVLTQCEDDESGGGDSDGGTSTETNGESDDSTQAPGEGGDGSDTIPASARSSSFVVIFIVNFLALSIMLLGIM